MDFIPFLAGITVECTKSGGALREQFNPLPLMSKGEQ
jgi:hypothetical protein